MSAAWEDRSYDRKGEHFVSPERSSCEQALNFCYLIINTLALYRQINNIRLVD